MKHNNLRNKTVFDLTKDKQLLVDELGILETEDQYKKLVATDARISDMKDLAELLADTALLKAINLAFKKELSEYGLE
jgi:hypothetical protein